MGSKKKEAKEKPLDKMTAKELRDVAKEISELQCYRVVSNYFGCF